MRKPPVVVRIGLSEEEALEQEVSYGNFGDLGRSRDGVNSFRVRQKGQQRLLLRLGRQR